ncbi:MAG: hypothetical protein PQJ28_02075 [Spirochaetales bacterium]|nr:hypothetical protein [Spirochaetales bacterium]
MKVTDLNGYEIEVTDLDEAIRKTGAYKEYRHEDKGFEDFDRRQQAYWTDMYDKLVAIRGQENETSKT